MSVNTIASLAELQKLLAQPRLTVVDFFATWCGPCKMIAPQLEALARSKPHVNFAKVDVDRCPDIVREYPVRSVPTFRFFKGGQVVQTREGADIKSVESIVADNEVLPPPPIPSEEELKGMRPTELLQLMNKLHIDSTGLLEKPELILKLNQFR